MRTKEMDRSDATDQAGGDAASLTLFVAYSPDRALSGQTLTLDRPLQIGRAENAEADVRIDDGCVSRLHATVRPKADGSGVELIEHQSRNGIFVDGQRTEGGLVSRQAVLRIGDTLFVVAGSPRTAQVRAQIANAAPSDIPVLLLGETGTGKDVMARQLHALSGRSGPFVTVNSAAIPKDLVESYLFGHLRGAFTGAVSDRAGFFAEASGGTLFFDEIGELHPDLQAKLLRVLENREYSPVGSARVEHTDARIVAATNIDLAREAGTGAFRRDLYGRIAGAIVRLAALRQRREEIVDLTRGFLAEHGRGDMTWSANFTERLLCHPWPMNIRELRMTVQRLVLDRPHQLELRRSHLEAALDVVSTSDEDEAPLALADAPPRAELVDLLTRHRGNVSELGKHYGKDRKQVYRWLRRYRLDSADFR
jgi:DNA-binding NtrC family response regulator